MRFYKVLPNLDRSKQLNLWHKALRSQWSAADLDWSRPQRITSRRLKDQLARFLTPVLMGEQAALYSVSDMIPRMGQRGEFEGQLYLTTWAVDEGRHTELFARFFHRIDREPLSIRRFPSGYLFQSQIVSTDPMQWLSGVLVSEVLAKLVMRELERLDLDPILSELAHGILKDEARHLGFNHIYVEDRFKAMFRDPTAASHDGVRWKRRDVQEFESGSDGPDDVADRLTANLDQVLSFVPPILEALAVEVREMGIDREEILALLAEEARWRLARAVEAGRRIAAGDEDPSDPAEAEAIGA